ncbi:hypothetical protein J4216_02460 [Candidatus Woesearchaeota archaeon]|nr:hypothetical protein [Candidatus Woesearchaeota archaeon]
MKDGIVIRECNFELIENISKTPDVCVMELNKGQAIKEHTHGNSMYFAKNVKFLTVNGRDYELPRFSWVFIPEGLSHGWRGVFDSGFNGEVFSYHSNHKEYSLVSV